MPLTTYFGNHFRLKSVVAVSKESASLRQALFILQLSSPSSFLSLITTMLVSTTALSLLSFIGMVQAHGFILGIKGSNGKTANGFGVNIASVKPNNQGPTSVFQDRTAPCGVGVEAGKINVAASIEAAIAAGLPTTDGSRSISMNWQQINAGNDGGGPGTAAIDITGTGTAFKPLTITKNFADGGANSANPMTIQLAAGTVCTGGSNRATCLIKVTNAAGPFGSCFAIASPGAGGGGARTQRGSQRRSFADKHGNSRRGVRGVLPRAGAADFGNCDVPKIAFGLFDGRKENSFAPVGSDFIHGSALNPGIITGFICSQLNGQCKANAVALGDCQAAIDATKGLSGQAAADAFNTAVAAGV